MFNQQLSKKQLTQLGQFLDQQKNNASDSMNLTELHGLLCAILSGPITIMPNQWHRFAFGDDGLEFENEEQAQAILPMFSQLNNHIIYQLEGNCICDPLVYQDNQILSYIDASEDSLQRWCAAYLEGTRFDNSWSEEKAAVENLFPIGVLANEFNLFGELDSSGKKITDEKPYKEQFKSLLPQIVFELYHFWKNKRKRQLTHVL